MGGKSYCPVINLIQVIFFDITALKCITKILNRILELLFAKKIPHISLQSAFLSRWLKFVFSLMAQIKVNISGLKHKFVESSRKV